MLTNNKIAANGGCHIAGYSMNVENEEEYFDAIPNSPPIYTGMTSVVMHKLKISIPQHPHLL